MASPLFTGRRGGSNGVRPGRVALAVTGLLAALLIAADPAPPVDVPAVTADDDPPPTTEFEDSDGAQWTSHTGELEFLAEVAARSDRVAITEIGRTHEDRPLHLVILGDPPASSPAQAHDEPTALHVCTQHGNEPAPREACLQWLRDLAFTDDPTLVEQLGEQTVLFIPTANPDGRASNSRRNANGVDINRDHLDFSTPEAQAIAAVVRDWRPDAAADLHEYGPSVPVVYDDDLLYLWPRNLNVDRQVYTLAKALAVDYVGAGAEKAGYTADEYGILSAREEDVFQIAGGPDEGIARNALGLRHVASILVETAVTPNPRQSPTEVVDEAENRRRRVATHVQAIDDTLRFMRDHGSVVAFVNDDAPERKAAEGAEQSAPVYFGGADNEEPAEEDVVDPPPCQYRIDTATADRLEHTFALHDIFARPTGDAEVVVPMGQAAEPVIPLLLDARGNRSVADGTPVFECDGSGTR